MRCANGYLSLLVFTLGSAVGMQAQPALVQAVRRVGMIVSQWLPQK